jgi:hypothetical protein
MPSLQEVLKDPNYVNANEATKQEIFNKYSAMDVSFTGANQATQDAIRQKFGVGVPSAEVPKAQKEEGIPDTGFTGGFKSTVEKLKGETALTAGKLGIMDTKKAEEYRKEKEEEAQRIFKPTEKSWAEAPLEKLKETAGQSAAYMAAPLAAAVGVALLPEAAVGAGIGAVTTAGLASAGVSFGQYTGSNLGRQVDEGKTLADADIIKAGAAAVPQAALDIIGFRMIPGISNLFTKAGVKITEDVAEDIAKKTMLRAAGEYSLKTGKVMTAEGLTEVGQQVLERMQAGLNLTDPEARKEYFENFVGGAALGGALSIPGNIYESSRAKKAQEKEIDKTQEEIKVPEETKNLTPDTPTPTIPTPPGSAQDVNKMMDELNNKPVDFTPETTPEAPAAPEVPVTPAPEAPPVTPAPEAPPTTPPVVEGMPPVAPEKPTAAQITPEDIAKHDKVLSVFDEYSYSFQNKGEVKRYAQNLVKQGYIQPEQLKSLDYLFKDKDMGPEDVSSEVRGYLESNIEKMKQPTPVAEEPASEVQPEETPTPETPPAEEKPAIDAPEYRMEEAWKSGQDQYTKEKNIYSHSYKSWNDIPYTFKQQIYKDSTKNEDGSVSIPQELVNKINDFTSQYKSDDTAKAWSELSQEPFNNLPYAMQREVNKTRYDDLGLTQENIKPYLDQIAPKIKAREDKRALLAKKYEEHINRPYKRAMHDYKVKGKKEFAPIQKLTQGAKNLGEALTIVKNELENPLGQSLVANDKKSAALELINQLLKIDPVIKTQYFNSNDIALSGRNFRVDGVYYRRENHIFMFPNSNLYVLLHEATHAATVHAVDYNPELKIAFTKMMNASKKSARGKPTMYGHKNVLEFIAEAFSNPEFQYHLATTPSIMKDAKKNSLWDDFRDMVKKFLFNRFPNISLETNTLFDDVMNASGTAFTGKDLEGFMGDMRMSGKFSDRLESGRMSDMADRVRRIFRRPQEIPAEIPQNTATNIYGQQVQGVWHGPTESKLDNILYQLQDKLIDTKRVQEIIQKAGRDIGNDWDVYGKEKLYHGRTADGLRQFLLKDLMPVINEMHSLKVTPDEMETYLLARHAKERNDQMNKINPGNAELKDKASGMSTADADAYLSNLSADKKRVLQQLGSKFDSMIRGTQQVLVDSGAETQSTIDLWNDMYKHYVPLFRKEDELARAPGLVGTGQGLGSRGTFSKRAMGSLKAVDDILGNIIAQRERALIRAEKIRVGRALFGLVLQNANPKFWLAINPDAVKSKNALIAELSSLGLEDPEGLANNLMKEPTERYLKKEVKVTYDPDTGLPIDSTKEVVDSKINVLNRYKDNVFPVRINGKDRYIFFNAKDPRALRMVQALKNLDVEQVSSVVGILGQFTRWFKNVNTQYNPIFGFVNLNRDIQGAMLNLSTTPIKGQQKAVLAGVLPAMRGVLNVLRDERKGITDTQGPWAELFKDARANGFQTGYRESLVRTAEEKKFIQNTLDKIKDNNAKKAFGYIVNSLSDFNDMMENAIRLSAYKVALDKGLSKQDAAILAKDLTVNFDKKGQLTSNINSLYAFFNASVQGTERIARTLLGPAGRKIIYGGIIAGGVQGMMLAAAGYGDDDPPEFVRERNFIVPLAGGKYVTIPYPLGFNIFPNFGRTAVELWLYGKPGERMANLSAAVADSFNPLGSTGFSLQTITPTALDPLMAVGQNKDAFGRPIFRPDRSTNPTPGYTRSRESSSEISKQLAYYLNLASGGSKYQKGYYSPTADEIDYYGGQLTGGIGREIMKVGQAIKSTTTGEELPSYRIPLAGRFYGETGSQAAISQRFYKNITEMANYEQEAKGRKKNKEDMSDFLKDHPEARLWRQANTVENKINALNKKKRELIDKDVPKERLQQIEEQKARMMEKFNNKVKALQKSAE